MRILLINNYHYQKGGADGVYFNTAKLLEQNGHEIFFFSTSDPKNFATKQTKYFPPKYNFRKLSFIQRIKAIPSFIYNKKAKKSISSILNEIKPDLAHIHLFMGGLSSSILLALKKYKIPVIQTVHDYRLICPAYSFTNGDKKICEKCKDQFYLRCMINKCSENNLAQSAILTADAYFRKYAIKPVKLIDFFIFVSQFSKINTLNLNPYLNPKPSNYLTFNPN